MKIHQLMICPVFFEVDTGDLKRCFASSCTVPHLKQVVAVFWPQFQKILSQIVKALGVTKRSSFQTWVSRTPESLRVSFQIRTDKCQQKQFFGAILQQRSWIYDGSVLFSFSLLPSRRTCSRPQIGGPQPASFDFSKKCFGE